MIKRNVFSLQTAETNGILKARPYVKQAQIKQEQNADYLSCTNLFKNDKEKNIQRVVNHLTMLTATCMYPYTFSTCMSLLLTLAISRDFF